MGSQVSSLSKSNEATNSAPQVSASGKKICCVCKETKAARDDCIAKNGEEQCKEFIELHNQCLRNEGFTVN